MAIIIEEEKNRTNLIRLIAWVVVVVVVAAAAYYIFFAAPELVVVAPPASFQSVAPISQVNLQPDDVLNSPGFKSLSAPAFPLPTPTGPAAVGRTNPFIPD